MAEWKDVLREVHRRSLWQVAGVYALISWGVLQVTLALYEALGLPEWVPPVTVVLLVIGLPVVLVTAFAHKRLPKASDLVAPAQFDPTLHPNLADDAGAPLSANGIARVLTWRRSLIAGVGAFTLLASGTTGFVVIERRGTLVSRGLVDSDRPVILADFANTSRDTTLGRVVTEALRVDLQQSNVVRLAQGQEIEMALQRMQRTQAQGLPSSVARELAEREGMRAVITGQVSPLAGGYVLTSTVISADSGRTLASFRSQARDSTELINAINDLSKQMRRKVGESVRSVRSAMPLAEATTASLPALRKYTEGLALARESGNNLRAVDLMKEAVAIDSTFGDAWSEIGIALSNTGVRPAQRNEALTRAYALRDRLPEDDRYVTEALYLELVNGDTDGAINAYRQLLAVDSTNLTAMNNLSILLTHQHQYDEAITLLTRVVQDDPGDRSGWINLIIAQYRQGNDAAAAKTVAVARKAVPHNFELHEYELNVAANGGHWEKIDSIANAIAATYPANPAAQLEMQRWRTNAALGLGHFQQALAMLTTLHARQNAGHFPGLAVLSAVQIADMYYYSGDTKAAVREIDDALRENSLSGFPPGEGPDISVAVALVHYGEVDRAARIMDARRTAMGAADEQDRFLRAAMDATRGQAAAASAAARMRLRLDSVQCTGCRLYELGRAYEAAAAYDNARVAYEGYLSAPMVNRLGVQALTRADVLVRLAAIYERLNDKPHAIARYNDFVQQWATADAALQPHVADAKKRILFLQGKG